MVFLTERLIGCCLELGFDQLMVSSLVLMKVLDLVNHLEVLTDSYLVNMMELI